MGLIQSIKREAALVDGLMRTLKAYKVIDAEGTRTVADDIEESCDKHAANVAFRFEGASLTYAEFEARANRYAHWAAAQGLKTGDTVALLMSNRPDYVACWMGLTKVGVATALINTNLVGGPLTHCINIANADHVIVSGDLLANALAVAPGLTRNPKLWAADGPANGAQDFDEALAAASDKRPDKAARADLKPTDAALYVYTSGTTGAPKAAKMTHLRIMGMLRAFIGGGHGVESDRVYITLPLYHATGGLTGVGFALETGATVILRRKFSASHFWEEAAAEKATVFFYIGELCRYLLNAPPHPMERKHKLRIGIGNGLRPEVWEKFVERFKIAKMLEFYGSTEGNVSLLNFDGKVGAIGRVPKWMQSRLNIRLVKFDVETDAPVRNAEGFCVEADIDEPGEALGAIRSDDPRFQFQGYSGDPKQTEKKILRDVFEKGDAWFRTGDLLRRDKDDYFYFVDRIGDTFRWKGENVSTNEVGDVISGAPGVEEANVYGVKVGDMDGRAGMAAVTPGPGFDLGKLRAEIYRELAPYARPIFLRIQPAIETTGTFKYRKVDLVREGFDPAATSDALYYDDPAAGAYVPITPALAAEIQSGAKRL